MKEADLTVGEIVAVHGIRGTVKIFFYDGPDRPLNRGDTLRLRRPDRSETTYTVQWAKPHKRNTLLSLDEIRDRDQAEALIGARVVVRRADLPDLAEDEYYWVDLIGLAVYTVGDRYLGRLTRIFPTGGNDVYVVDGTRGEILVPAIASVVETIDLDNGIMRVNLPEGL